MKAIRINNLNNQAKLEFTNIEEPNVINKNDIKVTRILFKPMIP